VPSNIRLTVQEEDLGSVRDEADAVLVRGQRGQGDEEAVEYIASTDTLATARSTADYQY